MFWFVCFVFCVCFVAATHPKTMCNEHGHSHGHGKTTQAETGLLESLGPWLACCAIAVSVVLQVWPWVGSALLAPYAPGAVAWAPHPAVLVGALLLVLVVRTLTFRSGATTPQQRAQAAAQFQRSSPAFAAYMQDEQKQLAMAQHLSQAVRCRTISVHHRNGGIDDTTRREFLKLHGMMQDTYPLVHKHLERHVVNDLSLVYIWRGTEDETEMPYLVGAHQDVVPTPEAARWCADPFAGEIRDGHVWGRGTIDLKNMVVGWMEALEDLLQHGCVVECIPGCQYTMCHGGIVFLSLRLALWQNALLRPPTKCESSLPWVRGDTGSGPEERCTWHWGTTRRWGVTQAQRTSPRGSNSAWARTRLSSCGTRACL